MDTIEDAQISELKLALQLACADYKKFTLTSTFEVSELMEYYLVKAKQELLEEVPVEPLF